MPRDPFFRTEASPYLDVDAMTIGDAKKTLRISHQSAHPLIHGVDQLNAWYVTSIRSRHAANVARAFGVQQSLVESSIADTGVVASGCGKRPWWPGRRRCIRIDRATGRLFGTHGRLMNHSRGRRLFHATDVAS